MAIAGGGEVATARRSSSGGWQKSDAKGYGMDVWEDGKYLRRNKAVGPAQITWGAMWQIVGGKKGRYVLTARQIQACARRDCSTIRCDIEKLGEVGGARRDRPQLAGGISLYIYNPVPSHAEARADPQMIFPQFWQEPVGDLAPLLDQMNPLWPGAAKAATPKAQATGKTPRGNPRGEIPAHRGAGKSRARKPREFRGKTRKRSPRGKPRGENPAALMTMKEKIQMYTMV